MKIGLIDVDGHNFPNFALMKISAYHKLQGDIVEWASPLFDEYDIVYKSKIFTFSPDENYPWKGKVIKGGTGYDIKSKLPEEIENCRELDYSIYPNCDYSIQFFSRGCIRKCPFCLVNEKEGLIHSVTPHSLNPNGKHIEVLDNNFFANPHWREAVDYLEATGQYIKFHGVDVRIMTDEMAQSLARLKMKESIHIAWDLPNVDITKGLEILQRHISPNKVVCYVLIGFNSTFEQDLYRVRKLKEMKVKKPFVMIYRDYANPKPPTQQQKDFARWVNRSQLFHTMDFEDYSPRKGFYCREYLKK